MCNDGEKTLTKDEALEKAIEAGAEEVLEGFDDEDKPALKVTWSQFTVINNCLYSPLLPSFQK